MKYFQSIRTQLLLAIAITLFVFLVAALGGLYIFEKNELTGESIEKVTEIGSVLKAVLKKQMVTHDTELLNALVNEIMAFEKITDVSVINAEGVVKFSSDFESIGKKLFKDSDGCRQCHNDATGRNTLTLQTRNFRGTPILRNVTHIYNEAACFQCHPARQKNLGLLFVDYSTAGTDALISSTLSRLFLSVSAVFIIISLLIFYIANRLIHKPIMLLVDGAGEIKKGNFKKQIHYGGNTEFKILADSFNDMSEKLQNGKERIQERTSKLETANWQLAREIVKFSKAKEALHEREETNRLLLQAAGDGIFGVNTTGEITFVNPAALRMLGFTAAEMLSQGVHALIHHSREDGSSFPLEECPMYASYTYATESSMISDFLWRKDGSSFPVEYSSMPITKDDGKVNGAVVIFKDITERKQAEEEKRKLLEERLQHADKMEAIGTLAGGIAHDFNNLLMGIQGYASLLLMKIDSSHPHYERLKRIEEQVRRGADLTKQLLGFARGGRYEVKPTDMNDLLEKSSSLFGRTKKEISISRKYEKNLWPVEVDRGQMEQVFLNLYVNAGQAMPGGGDLYIETGNVFFDDAQAAIFAVTPGKYVEITVADTGIGMDEKTKVRIFDPFFTTKEIGKGTGLGLAMVYGIINGHKGVINVESEPGQGATFTIYLPASEQEAVQEKAATGTIARGAETILLVDDEQMILGVNKEMLEFIGYRVYAVGSGQEAIAVYMEKRSEIDLVILDMILPGISGSDTFDRLRRLNPGLKVLLASGYSINGEAQAIMDRGCNGFLQKPFRLESLSQKVREILD
ncbi:MAG: PAS domain S-box protein [Syntrophales bacterium]|jgi:PAS domain S-box-containing protein|nr:PAS domain S-box protein [Syntrophales bacterium]